MSSSPFGSDASSQVRRITRSVAVLAGGNAGSQFVVVLAAPIVRVSASTRLQTSERRPYRRDPWAAPWPWLSGRYELAIPLPADEETAFDLFILSSGACGSRRSLLRSGLASRELGAGKDRS